MQEEPNDALVLCFRKYLRDCIARGAVWMQDSTGRWYSEYMSEKQIRETILNALPPALAKRVEPAHYQPKLPREQNAIRNFLKGLSRAQLEMLAEELNGAGPRR